jgi:hypothetical protein
MADALKPQDLLVALKLVAHPGMHWTYKELASSLCMSASEVHQAEKRLERSRLYNSLTRRVVRQHLKEFLVHGVRYAFPAEEGDLSQGVPTAWSAAPLAGAIVGAAIAVWVSSRGSARGIAIRPLYKTAPDAALNDPSLHEWLALVDTLRVGRARERQLAETEISRRLA